MTKVIIDVEELKEEVNDYRCKYPIYAEQKKANEMIDLFINIIDSYADERIEAYDLAIKALEERPTGEWKHNNFDEHYCNKCGHYALWSEEADGYYEVQSNFCPNCGADMRKGEKE